MVDSEAAALRVSVVVAPQPASAVGVDSVDRQPTTSEVVASLNLTCSLKTTQAVDYLAVNKITKQIKAVQASLEVRLKEWANRHQALEEPRLVSVTMRRLKDLEQIRPVSRVDLEATMLEALATMEPLVKTSQLALLVSHK